MIKEYPKCLKCGGKVIKVDDELKCMLCGKQYTPRGELTIYYNQHMNEILQDVKKLGWKPTQKKWGCSTATILRLRRTQSVKVSVNTPSPVAPVSNNHLPLLPSFSDKWTPEVMTKWLETYQIVYTSSKREEVRIGKEHTATD